jgi:hypothetical protein
MKGTYNVGDVLNCITEKGEVNYTTVIEKYDNNIIGEKVIDGTVVIYL